jgi:hypothetical protein
MICYEILVNGERLCLAGIEPGVFAAYVTTWQGGSETEREPETHLHVSGVTEKKRFDWTESGQCKLKVGDELTIRVVEADTPDQGVHIMRKRGESGSQAT